LVGGPDASGHPASDTHDSERETFLVHRRLRSVGKVLGWGAFVQPPCTRFPVIC
jgi:hypothetical protein